MPRDDGMAWTPGTTRRRARLASFVGSRSRRGRRPLDLVIATGPARGCARWGRGRPIGRRPRHELGAPLPGVLTVRTGWFLDTCALHRRSMAIARRRSGRARTRQNEPLAGYSADAPGNLTNMPAYAPQKMLRRVSNAKKRDISHWREGRHLEKESGRTIDDLQQRAIADRWVLANSFRRNADRMMALQPPLYRDAISRYYYAMYHAMRSVVFFAEGGDDYEQHSALPGHTPNDLDETERWQNMLKDARERRNAADYDAYPKSTSAYRAAAQDLQVASSRFLIVTRDYLREKGCAHL